MSAALFRGGPREPWEANFSPAGGGVPVVAASMGPVR